MSVREFVRHNFWLKLFSLILATLIWFVTKLGFIKKEISLGQNTIVNLATREFAQLPVTVVRQPGDPRAFKVTPENVSVTLTGEAAVLRELSRREITIYVDMTAAQPAEGPTQRLKLHVPSGVTVVRVAPVAVQIETLSPTK
jgi:YbbR domain-containing protein